MWTLIANSRAHCCVYNITNSRAHYCVYNITNSRAHYCVYNITNSRAHYCVYSYITLLPCIIASVSCTNIIGSFVTLCCLHGGYLHGLDLAGLKMCGINYYKCNVLGIMGVDSISTI